MPDHSTIHEYHLVMPGPLKRWALLVSAISAGALVACTFVLAVRWADALLIMLVLAILAGVSTLWSP